MRHLASPTNMILAGKFVSWKASIDALDSSLGICICGYDYTAESSLPVRGENQLRVRWTMVCGNFLGPASKPKEQCCN